MRPRGITGTRKQILAELLELQRQFPEIAAGLIQSGEGKDYYAEFELYFPTDMGLRAYEISAALTWLKTAYKNLGYRGKVLRIGPKEPRS